MLQLWVHESYMQAGACYLFGCIVCINQDSVCGYGVGMLCFVERFGARLLCMCSWCVQTNELFVVEHTAMQPLTLRLHQLLDACGQLPRQRAVYFGSSTASITRELTLAEVSHLFHEGCVCVRSFNFFTGEQGLDFGYNPIA